MTNQAAIPFLLAVGLALGAGVVAVLELDVRARAWLARRRLG